MAVNNPRSGMKILEALRFDPSQYVRISVANHLNDIAKILSELVVKKLVEWENVFPVWFEKEFLFIGNRALCTQIKDGHRGALKYSGISLDPKKH